MPAAQQDTEITLGTGRMLAIFFAFVLICAVFFAIGFSLGRRTTMAGAGNLLSAPTAVPATIVRPSAAKNGAPQPAPQSSSNDFSFYKAVGEKNADSALTPQGSAAPPATPTATSPAADGTPKAAADAAIAAAFGVPSAAGEVAVGVAGGAAEPWGVSAESAFFSPTAL